MCGIAGFCNWTQDWRSNIERMNDRMYSRGPDASGVYAAEDGLVVLGHRRLSIVDLSDTGAQPMESNSGRYVMVYNGEIYNHKAIRERMLAENKATAFRGTSDTETLLEAIAAYGMEEALRMAKGMFAIAVYDKKERMLLLARDRVGEKPLYYGFLNGGKFVFASDLNAITALDGFQNPINTRVLENYFRYGYIAAPYSIYENIWKLEPGKILEIKSPFNNYDIKTYWSMQEAALFGQAHPFQGSGEEAAEELERLLQNAIRGQMAADVPVGAFLSAGIDSSTVVALMQHLSPQKVRSFTIGMWEKQFNEADAAKEIAAHLGTQHTELYITEKDAQSVIPQLAQMFGEPFADSSQIPTYLVSKMTREHVTVSLSGDGGDELFGGYGTYLSVARIWNKTKSVPYAVRKPISELTNIVNKNRNASLATKARLLGARGIEDMYLRSEIGEGWRIVKKGTPSCKTVMDIYPAGLLKDEQHNLMLMDLLMYHPDDILNKVDRTAMSVSLETRVPFLDKDVVEFAWTLPLACKISHSESGEVITKKILKDILYRHVPKSLLDRPKKGFAIPLSKWLKEPKLRAWAEDLMAGDLLKRQGILDAEAVRKLWEDFIERGVWRAQIWYVLMFQEWICAGSHVCGGD